MNNARVPETPRPARNAPNAPRRPMGKNIRPYRGPASFGKAPLPQAGERGASHYVPALKLYTGLIRRTTSAVGPIWERMSSKPLYAMGDSSSVFRATQVV